jgi:hypothetical protein
VDKLTFYEQTGIVIPGSVLVFGLTLMFPAVHELFGKDGLTIGGLGLFVLVAYASGHLMAAIGNVLESLLWWLPGMPSEWITRSGTRILNSEQFAKIEERARKRLNLNVDSIKGMARHDWRPVFAQIYSDVLQHNPGRIETFNANYGLNRGLAAAMVSFSVAGALLGEVNERAAGALMLLALVFAYRAYRFGVHFAREVYHRFLSLPAEAEVPGKISPTP